jgi:hypothetical protein
MQTSQTIDKTTQRLIEKEKNHTTRILNFSDGLNIHLLEVSALNKLLTVEAVNK